MRPQLLFRKIHKWLGLVLGIQILFWFVSGFLMSWMPIEEIHGDHLLQEQPKQTPSLQQQDLNQLLATIQIPVQSLKAKQWLNKTVIEVKTDNGLFLYDANNFRLISPINESQVSDIIAQKILPEYIITEVNLLDELPLEVRGRETPLWQVKLAGYDNPVIYISPNSGEIVAKRTSRWRLFDFLWMLHIMDYDERDDFNHPLLYITAFSALLFTTTGFVLLFYTLRRRRKAS